MGLSRRSVALALLAACIAAAAPAYGEDAPSVAAAPPVKILRVATSGDYAPFSFAAGGGPARAEGPLDGFDVEVARLFAKDRGYTVETVRFRWPDLSRELAAASFDIAMSGITVRPERSIAGRYSIPVANSHAVALTWKGSGATTVAMLDKPTRRIVVNAGGHLEQVADDAFRRAQILAIPDNDAVRMAILDRAHDAVLTDVFEAKVWSAGTSDVIQLGPLSDDRKAYLLPADRRGLAAELDSWLLARENDGTLAGLRERYFGGGAAGERAEPAAEVRTALPLPALTDAITERLALMPFVYEAKKRAGRPLEDTAQESVVVDRAMKALTDAAAAAAVSPARETAARPVFTALIELGKDAQRHLSGEDAKRRPGTVVDRRAKDAAGAPDKTAAAQKTDDEDAQNERDAAVTAMGRRVYDLDTEIRPAIGRITEKIARLLVALDRPVEASDVRRRLADSFVAYGTSVRNADDLVEAIANYSRTR